MASTRPPSISLLGLRRTVRTAAAAVRNWGTIPAPAVHSTASQGVSVRAAVSDAVLLPAAAAVKFAGTSVHHSRRILRCCGLHSKLHGLQIKLF